MKHLNYLLLLSSFISTNLSSQTLLFGGDTGNGNFENGTTGWTVVNGSQTNKWVVSTNATPGFSGSNCIYISSSPAAPYAHTYNENSASLVHFYKEVDVPADAKKLWLTFDYISNGETIPITGGTLMKDVLEVGIASASAAVTPGQPVQLPQYEWYYGKTAWIRKEVKNFNVTAFAGTRIRVVFCWENNTTVGNQPPAALDNIEMYASCQDMWPPTLSDQSATSARFVWSSIAGATGYQVRYRKTTDPVTASTYTNPVTVSGGGSAYYTSIYNLTPATSYYIEMRPTGLTCTDWTTPLTITTLTPPANDSCTGAAMLAVEANACDGTQGSFYGATPTAGLGGSCMYDINDDVWYKFVATQTTQVIQTAPPQADAYYMPVAISLFSGACTNLQLVPTGCIPASTYSNGITGSVNRLVATGLTVGQTYYLRVNASTNNTTTPFKICVYNTPPTPSCPVLITPSNNLTGVNYGVPQVFKWNKAANATAYRLLIIKQSGAYSQIDTKDTIYTAILDGGTNYTWKVLPYNIQDVSSTCGSFAFSTCSAVASGITLSAATTTKCAYDSLKITASPAGANRQWFLNGELINGATGDSIWAKVAGNYTVRVPNGTCYSDPSNTLIVTDLATPVRQKLTVSGATTFCQGGSVILTTPFSLNNQWFNGSTAISGSTSGSYTANQPGTYYVRLTNTSSGCPSYSDSVVVTVNPAPATPVITAGGSTALCTGGSVNLSSSATAGNQWYKDGTVISGAAAQQYSATQAGSYTVATTQSGCASAQSTAINVTVTAVPAAPAITASGALTFCAGDSVRLQSSAANGNQWYKDGVAITGSTGQQLWVKDAGSYTAKVTSGSCVSAASTASTVIVNPLPAQPSITGIGSVLSTTTGYTSYQWYFNGAAITGATSSQYTTPQNGIYKVEVSGANGCKIQSAQYNQVAAVVSEIVLAEYTIKLYPNPVQDLLTIKVAANSTVRSVTAGVVDVNGKQLKTMALKAGLNSLNLKNLAQGVYSVIIKNNQGQKTIQVVKVH